MPIDLSGVPETNSFGSFRRRCCAYRGRLENAHGGDSPRAQRGERRNQEDSTFRMVLAGSSL
jgi:hypothetical protein